MPCAANEMAHAAREAGKRSDHGRTEGQERDNVDVASEATL